MSFLGFELSRDSARPIELVEITYAGRYWWYTTSELAVVHAGKTFKPIPMDRTAIEPSSDSTKSNLTVTLPSDVEVAEVFRLQPPSEVVRITILALHHLDDEAPRPIWKGRVVNCSWELPWVKLTCDNSYTSSKRPGLRRRFSTQCTKVLYGPSCRASRELVKQTFTASVISGRTLTLAGVPSLPDDFFAGGYLQWEHETNLNIEYRFIRNSTGGIFELTAAVIGMSPGAVVDLFPGCDHNHSDCINKFGNGPNFGGFKYLPNKNPFGGSTLY